MHFKNLLGKPAIFKRYYSKLSLEAPDRYREPYYYTYERLYYSAIEIMGKELNVKFDFGEMIQAEHVYSWHGDPLFLHVDPPRLRGNNCKS